MRLIDADKLDGKIDFEQQTLKSDNDKIWQMNKGYFKGLAWARRLLIDAPTVDAVEVVRCKDCKHGEKCYGAGGVSVSCEFSVALKDPNGFCDDGDPKEVSE